MFDSEYFKRLNDVLNEHKFISNMFDNYDLFNICELFDLINNYCVSNHIYNVKNFKNCYNFKYEGNGYEIERGYGPEEVFFIRKCNCSSNYLDFNDILFNRVKSNDKTVSDVMNNLISNIQELYNLDVPRDIIENETVSFIRKLNLKK